MYDIDVFSDSYSVFYVCIRKEIHVDKRVFVCWLVVGM